MVGLNMVVCLRQTATLSLEELGACNPTAHSEQAPQSQSVNYTSSTPLTLIVLLFSCQKLLEQRFFYGVAGAVFYFDKDFADILADDADGNEDKAAEKPY